MEDVRYSPGVQFTLHSESDTTPQRSGYMSGCQRLVSACLNLLQIVTEMSQTSETCHKLSPICHRTPDTARSQVFVTEMSLCCHSASHTLHTTEGDIVWAQADDIKCHIHTTPGCQRVTCVTRLSPRCRKIGGPIAIDSSASINQSVSPRRDRRMRYESPDSESLSPLTRTRDFRNCSYRTPNQT